MAETKETIWTRSFTLICSSNFMTILAFYSMMPVMALFLEDVLQLDEGMSGFAIGIYTVSALASRLLCGYLLDSYGRRIVFFFSLLFFSAMYFFYLLPMSWAGVILLRIAHGMAWGMASASSQTVAVDCLPAARRGEGIGFFGLSVALGMAVSPAIGMWFIEDFSYQALFIFEGIACLGALALAVPVRFRKAPPVRPAFTPANLLERTSVPISIMAFVIYMGFGASINWIAVYAKISGGSPGLFFTFMAIGTGFTRMTTGKIFDRRGPLGVSALGFAVFAASLFCLALWPSEIMLYAGGFMIGAGSGVFMPVSLAIINSLVVPDRRGATNSTYYTFFDCGIGAGVILTGLLIPYIGLQGAFAVFGCTVLIGAVYFYVYAWPYSRRQQQIRGGH